MKNIIILITALMIASCGTDKKKEAKKVEEVAGNIASFTDAQKKNAGIVTGNMERRTVSATLQLNGKIDVPPQNILSVSVPLGGYLKSTHLLPGMHINKGETIAIVEDQQYIQLQQDYLTAKARLVFIENEYRRQKELNLSKASSDKVYQQAEADLKTQKVMISALSERLKLVGINPDRLNENNISRTVNIYSPISGYVSKVNVNIGKYVSPTEVLFELINPTDIHLALKVFEKDLDKLFVGQKVVAFTNNETGKKYDCEIILISRDLSADRTADIHCHFEEYDKKLLPGMYMNAEIPVSNAAAWALPEAAIVRFENKQYAFIQKNEHQFEITEVTTGNSEKGFVEILNAERFAGKVFVTTNAYALLMSLKNKSEE
ncbi:efflux transporter periplasmic adaptor subunit [Flavipsychrobacter stenotrophus]|uniref:Efflux transporter periplasmic adaptor subunit n=1 Tax=Flavipsychrobacter stenotrophus TaxID=2077091 RepID=A0A2S7STR6_9BACT|nr:efflux RND transporter periplasmic adaptor subunit [Flavipsychrobacter stenotrophus]PQJ10144.1 efflux transporter periplasmic adaptor subunit [Flavipsychrobacter stenotrophus]